MNNFKVSTANYSFNLLKHLFHYSGCPRDTDAWNIEWPLTDVGSISSQSCPGSQGKQIL